MPFIRPYTSNENIRSGLQSASATPAEFGAGIGAAVTDIGGAIAGLGATVRKVRSELSQDEAASAVATFDYSKRMLDRQTQATPGAAGFYDATGSDYDQAVDQHLANIKDPQARKAARQDLMARRPGALADAARFETSQAAGYSKLLADQGLDAIQNRVRTDPDSWVLAKQDADRLIDRQTSIPPAIREEMKTNQAQNLTRWRFEALISDAQDTASLNAVEKDINSGRWDQYFAPTDKANVLDAVRTSRTSLNTKADADATAALASVKDRVDAGVIVDPREMQAVAETVKRSNNPARLWSFTEMQERQRIRGQESRLPPSALNAEIVQGDGQQNVIAPSMPPDLNNAINHASEAVRGVIPTSYLVGTVAREYGGHIASGDWSRGNDAGASSAVGPFQFTASTWLDIVSRHGEAFGLTPKEIDDDPTAVLKLRTNVDAATLGAAFLAQENKQKVETALGRSITDPELYMAHFLGAGGAIQLLKTLQTDPDSSAAKLLPDAAAANDGVFYDHGRALSVREVYGDITAGFMGSPSRIDYVRNDERKKMAVDQKQGLADDPMTWAANSGSHAVGAVDSAAGMVARGATARSVADYYSIPTEDMKPFTKDEAADLTKKIKEGRSDDVLNIMSQIQGMGPEMARAAYKQLGEKEPVFEYAARLATDGHSGPAAADIIRGQKRIAENPDLSLGKSKEDISTAFATALGGSISGIAPRDAQAIRDAALAHYAETYVSRGNSEWSDEAFGKSVDAVLGATNGQPAIGAVNGSPTLLPAGMTADETNQVLDKMTPADYIAASIDGKPPRYADGAPVSADDISAEGKLRAVGRDLYQVQMSDGNLLATDVAAGGQVSFYIMHLDAQFGQDILQRPAQNVTPRGRIFPFAQ